MGRLRGGQMCPGRGQIRGEAIVGGETKREQNSFFESGVFPCMDEISDHY